MRGGEVGTGGGQAAVEGAGMDADRICGGFVARVFSPAADGIAFAGEEEAAMNATPSGRAAARAPFDAYGAVTHEVINQPVELADVNLYDSDAALRDGVRREGAEWAANSLGAFGARLGSAESFERGALANRNPPELDTHDRYGRRVDLVRFHPAYHELMRSAIEEGLHSSPWTEPREGAQVARAARFYMQSQVEAGHGCPITMTFAAVPCLKTQPDLARDWLPKITARVYDPRNVPAAEKQGLTIGMAMTEKQGGSDVRANTTRAIPVGSGGPGQAYELVGHKFFVSAPMCDAFLVLAQAPGGLSCFLVPRWRAGRDEEPAADHSPEAQDGQRLERLERDGAARRARLDGRARGTGRRDHPRDGGDDPVRLHDRLVGRHAAGGRRGDRPLPAAQGVRRAARRPADHDRRARRPRDRGRGGADADAAHGPCARPSRRRRTRTRSSGSARRSENTGSASAFPATPPRRWNASAARG